MHSNFDCLDIGEVGSYWHMMVVNSWEMKALTLAASEKFISKEEALRQYKGLKLCPEQARNRKDVCMTPLPPLPPMAASHSMHLEVGWQGKPGFCGEEEGH